MHALTEDEEQLKESGEGKGGVDHHTLEEDTHASESLVYHKTAVMMMTLEPAHERRVLVS